MPRISSCWANVLDDCEGKLTREHIISVAAIQHPDPKASRAQKEQRVLRHTYVQGPRGSWTREVAVADLVGRMLCERHNRGSSELDIAGGALSDAIRYFVEAARDREYSRLRWAMKMHELDGPLVERWLMKTAINMTVGYRERRRVGSGDAEPNRPSRELAEMVFGHRPVVEPYGIWFVTRTDDQLVADQSFSTQPWVKGDVLGGTLFSICGFQFAVSLSDDEPPWDLLSKITGWRQYRSVRHLREFRQERYGVGVRLQWPASLPQAVLPRHRALRAQRPSSAVAQPNAEQA